MFTGEPVFDGRPFYFFFIFYMKQFTGPVITANDLSGFCIHDQDTIKGCIINRINKMFFFQYRFFMVPVDPENKIGEKSSEGKRDRQV